MSSAVGEIKYNMTIDKSSVSNSLKNTGKKITSWGNKIGSIVGGIIGAGLFVGATKEWLELQKSLRQVNVLSQGAIDIKKLKDEAEELSKTFGINATDSVNAFYQAISAGNTEKGARNLTKVATALAAVGAASGEATDVKGAMDGLTSVLNAFGISAENATNVADMMSQSIVLGKTSINAMAGSLGRVAPLANTLGLSLKDILAPLDALTSQGMSTDEAMTAIRQTMMSMLKPSTELQKVIKNTGYETGQAMLQANGLAGTLQILEQQVDGTKVQWADLFNNARALAGVAGLAGTKASMEKLIEMEKKLGESTGLLGKQTKLFTEDPATKWQNGINRMKLGVMGLIDGVGGLANVITILMSIFAAFKVGSMIVKIFSLASAFAALAVAKAGAQSGILAPFAIAAVVSAIVAGMAAFGVAKVSGMMGAGSSTPSSGNINSNTPNEQNKHTTVVVNVDPISGRSQVSGNGNNNLPTDNFGRGGSG